MTNRPNLPSTSHEANRKATSEMRDAHKNKIVGALRELVSANYETIGNKCKLDKHAVHRRINELERDGVVYNTKIKTATSSGRSANNYSLISTPIQTPIEIVNTIIENATKPTIQTDLFGNAL